VKEPIRILSDLHLGHKVSRIRHVSALRPLIAGVSTVILNGDTWQEVENPFRDLSEQMLADFISLCADEGVEPVFLPGNHDPGWPGCGWIELAGGRVIVTHGDALMFDSSPWKREILHSTDKVNELWERHPDASHDPNERLRLARDIARTLCSVEFPHGRHFIQRAWDAAIPPKRAAKMLEAWFTQGSMGSRFCETYFPKAEALIVGHFHYHGRWLHRGRLIIDSGSFMNPGRAHWLEWNDGWLTRGEIDETPEFCRLGRKLDVWRF
jgi:hypothetical protein